MPGNHQKHRGKGDQGKVQAPDAPGPRSQIRAMTIDGKFMICRTRVRSRPSRERSSLKSRSRFRNESRSPEKGTGFPH
jgi:hypothetical protein